MKRRKLFSRRDLRAFTLVELLVALVVISIISVAVFTMTAGATSTSLYVTAGTDTVSEVETAYRRMLHNLRTCSAISAPTGTTASNTLTVVTQPDASNGGTTYTVSYAVSNGSLVETDSRYGSSNTLLTGVTGFSVTRNSVASPQTVTVALAAGKSPAVARTVTIYCRNL